MADLPVKVDQNASPNNKSALIVVPANAPDGLRVWMDWYFKHAVTTSPNSQKEQRRDIESFIKFMEKVDKTDERIRWTPRLSEAYKEHMRSVIRPDGHRVWSDRTINRVIAHLKTFARGPPHRSLPHRSSTGAKTKCSIEPRTTHQTE